LRERAARARIGATRIPRAYVQDPTAPAAWAIGRIAFTPISHRSIAMSQIVQQNQHIKKITKFPSTELLLPPAALWPRYIASNAAGRNTLL
jgi:hypothetical protein